ncbi:DNA/RNA non-specific endonuclease [Streptomyces sp. NPDC059071]|uniref:DNA/RNA non-specific endonuclease n=1 Tax=unclassified Streptomyces TaxID=2593676 RepID=UPI00365C67E9
MSRINPRIAVLISTTVAASLLTAVPVSADHGEPRRRAMGSFPVEQPLTPTATPIPAPVADSESDPETDPATDPDPAPNSDVGYGAELAVTGEGAVYALAADHGSVWKWEGDGTDWTRIGGPADSISAGRAGLFTISPQTREVFKYGGKPDSWTRVGDASADVVVHGDEVYRAAADHSGVFKWSKKNGGWNRIGGSAKRLFLGGAGLFATSPTDVAIYRYGGERDEWERIGGPGSTFAVDNDDLYGVSPDGSAVFRWKQDKKDRTAWEKIGGPARELYAGGAGLFATSPTDGALHKYDGEPGRWRASGSAGAIFAVNDKHAIGLSPDRRAFFQSEKEGEGEPWKYIGGPSSELQELKDEQTLLQERGQEYLDEFRRARDLERMSLSEWLQNEGLGVLLDVIGVSDVEECLSAATSFDVDVSALFACLSSAVKPVGMIRAVTKVDKVGGAVKKAVTKLPRYSKGAAKARKTVNDARKILDKVKEKPEERDYKPQVFDCRRGAEGWQDLGSTDPTNGDRPTGTTACLDKAYLAKNLGSLTDVRKVKPPAYDWAARTMAYHGNKVRFWRNACHLLGNQLNGSGLDLRNLSTCTRAANAYPIAKDDPGLPQHMLTFETRVRNAVDAGQVVWYQVTPKYSGARTVPVTYEMTARGLTPDGRTGLVLDEVVPNSAYSNKFKSWFNLGLVTNQARLPVPLKGER